MSGDREAIGVVGVGWVGLVTAACFAEVGHRVIARDILPEKVEALSRGEITIHEPGLAELLARNAERLTFTTDMGELLEAASLLFVCVDTPPTVSGDADLSRVRSVVGELSPGGGHTLVMKSTVPAGTGHSIRRDLPGVPYVSCPEFLKEGSAVEDFMHPDRVVIGADAGDEVSADAVARLYEPLGGEIVRTDVASAEMIKLASNAFLATKISFVNEIANVCEEVGADVAEVARGMGLDQRIGPAFLRPGIGYGGSCFDGKETVLIRHHGTPKLVTFEELWDLAGGDGEAVDGEAIAAQDLWAWSWVPGELTPEWMPISLLTKRDYQGDMIEVRTKMGRKIKTTADHPFVVGDGKDDQILARVLASELDEGHWLPAALGGHFGHEPSVLSTLGALDGAAISPEEVVVRPDPRELGAIAAQSNSERATLLMEHPSMSSRPASIRARRTLPLTVAAKAEINFDDAEFAASSSGNFLPQKLDADERFWRVVGLYLAEGCIAKDHQRRDCGIVWTFHPEERHLADEVATYWEHQGIKARICRQATSLRVDVSSRILTTWWTDVLGLGRTSYEQRIPNFVWEQSARRKWALLSAMWEGDGSWSFVNGGPSVVLEWGTISDELADGTARLLGDLGVVCGWRRGRTAKSTKETHWLRISGAEQVERALCLVPESQQARVLEALERQSKRIAPTGYRRFGDGLAWVRVVKTKREKFNGPVYSLKVPGSETVVASGSLVLSQCFPKDVSALKMLAGNSGYHFQLLNAVIEVNELQKRRVVGKLQKHLGSLLGKRVALLGLAFKPHTDDMREASSLVLAARLEGEGAEVAAYDPVAADVARGQLGSVELRDSALEALDGADAAILVTEWPEFAELDWAAAAERMARPLLIDGRNFLDPALLRGAGFEYEGIGRAVEGSVPAGTPE
jgi:UDP-glucose 6-dehydrogenase